MAHNSNIRKENHLHSAIILHWSGIYFLTISVWAVPLTEVIQTYKIKGPFGSFQSLKLPDTLETNVFLEYIKET